MANPWEQMCAERQQAREHLDTQHSFTDVVLGAANNFLSPLLTGILDMVSEIKQLSLISFFVGA